MNTFFRDLRALHLPLLIVCSLAPQLVHAAPAAAASEDDLRAPFKNYVRLNQEASCHRPVLRGTARKGSALPAMRQLFGEDGLLAACEAELLGPMGLACATSSVAGQVETTTDRTLDPTLANAPSCNQALAVIRDAVTHEDACGPWRLGVGDFELRDYQLAHWFLQSYFLPTAQRQFYQGRRLPALQLTNDFILFSLDLSRGTTPLVPSMVAAGLTAQGLEGLAALLGLGPLSQNELVALRTDLDRLTGQLHHPRSLVIAELYEDILRPAWSTASPQEREHFQLAGPTMHPKVLTATLEQLREVDRLCPPSVTARGCLDRIEEAAQLRDENSVMTSPFKRLLAGIFLPAGKIDRIIAEHIVTGVTIATMQQARWRLEKIEYGLSAVHSSLAEHTSPARWITHIMQRRDPPVRIKLRDERY